MPLALGLCLWDEEPPGKKTFFCYLSPLVMKMPNSSKGGCWQGTGPLGAKP